MTEFVLTSTEGGSRRSLRCHTVARLKGAVRDDYMLVECDTPAETPCGPDLARSLILVSRYEGESLFGQVKWPAVVNVLCIKDNALLKDQWVTPERFVHFDIAELQRIVDHELPAGTNK